jgi:hypothetical protein
MVQAVEDTTIYKTLGNFHRRRHNEALDILKEEGCSKSNPVFDGGEVMRFSSGAVAIYLKNEAKGLLHAVFNQEGKLQSMSKGDGMFLSKDGDGYLLAISGMKRSERVDADSPQVTEIEQRAQQFALEHAR